MRTITTIIPNPPVNNMESIPWSRELVGEMQLLIAVLFFGISFVLQRIAMLNNIGPLTYNACRFIISTTILMCLKPILKCFLHSEIEKTPSLPSNSNDKLTSLERYNDENATRHTELIYLWVLGGGCGISNFFGATLQQMSLVSLSAGKVGFITGMYVVMVPIVEWIIPGFGGQLTANSWIAALVGLIGLYFLSGCFTSHVCIGGAIGAAEIIAYISVLFWVASIMLSDIGSKICDAVSLTVVDFFICTIFCIIVALIYEPEYWQYPYTAIYLNTVPICVVGFTEASAFLLCSLGQMYSNPTRTSLLLSLESVSCAVLGYIVLGETFTSVELFGCCLMFASTLITTSFNDIFNRLTTSVSSIRINHEDETIPINYTYYQTFEMIDPQVDRNEVEIRNGIRH